MAKGNEIHLILISCLEFYGCMNRRRLVFVRLITTWNYLQLVLGFIKVNQRTGIERLKQLNRQENSISLIFDSWFWGNEINFWNILEFFKKFLTILLSISLAVSLFSQISLLNFLILLNSFSNSLKQLKHF